MRLLFMMLVLGFVISPANVTLAQDRAAETSPTGPSEQETVDWIKSKLIGAGNVQFRVEASYLDWIEFKASKGRRKNRLSSVTRFEFFYKADGVQLVKGVQCSLAVPTEIRKNTRDSDDPDPPPDRGPQLASHELSLADPRNITFKLATPADLIPFLVSSYKEATFKIEPETYIITTDPGSSTGYSGSLVLTDKNLAVRMAKALMHLAAQCGNQKRTLEPF